jgi:COMPASS component SWD1
VQTSLFALASFARFDPTGRYVATGRVDGTAAIWDLDTRAAVRILDGHVKAVSSLEYAVSKILWVHADRVLRVAGRGIRATS